MPYSEPKKFSVVNDPVPNPLRKGAPSLADAAEPMAPGTKPHHMSDPWDIGETLCSLADNGDAVSIYSNGDEQPIMARVLSVDDDLPQFVLELNEGQTLPDGNATFVSWVHSAKLQFTINGEWQHHTDRPNVYLTNFPSHCLVLERRESARMETPLGVYYIAAFVLEGRPYELQLYDFSAGGIGMRAHPRDTVGLYVGRKLSRVRLELGPTKVMIADLEIRLSRTFRSFLLGEQVQIGCRFLNLTDSMREELTVLLDNLGSGRKVR